MMDSAAEDGPISVAFNMRPSLRTMIPKRPSPDTLQYPNRMESWLQEKQLVGKLPRHPADVCGYVQAAITDEHDHSAKNKAEYHRLGFQHNEVRLVFQSISGWVLMVWRSQEEFEEGIHGDRRAPRPIAWFDLREAVDLEVTIGDYFQDLCPHLIRILMKSGNYYFRVELPEDVPVWYMAIKRLIQDACIDDVRLRDTETHKMKRWPAACGIAKAILGGWPIGERALAIAFHCYDIDYDCALKTGELMVLIQELLAAMLHDEGRAEGQDRATAVMSAASRVSEDDLYERAIRFRRRCDNHCEGKVRKDNFIIYGHSAILEALDMGTELPEEDRGKEVEKLPGYDVQEHHGNCSVM